MNTLQIYKDNLPTSHEAALRAVETAAYAEGYAAGVQLNAPVAEPVQLHVAEAAPEAVAEVAEAAPDAVAEVLATPVEPPNA